MVPQTDYFTLYDLQPTLTPDAAAVRKRFYDLSRTHHPDRAGGDAAAQSAALQQTAHINEGYRLLSDPDALLGYVLQREGVLEEGETYQLPPAFLMEIMELNEAVGNAAMDPNLRSEARQEATAALDAWQAAAAPLMARYNSGDREAALLAALKDAYYRKKYLLRLQEQIERA